MPHFSVVPGLHHNSLFKPILEGRTPRLQHRRRDFNSLRRLCRKNLGSRHVFCKRQEQVPIPKLSVESFTSCPYFIIFQLPARCNRKEQIGAIKRGGCNHIWNAVYNHFSLHDGLTLLSAGFPKLHRRD